MIPPSASRGLRDATLVKVAAAGECLLAISCGPCLSSPAPLLVRSEETNQHGPLEVRRKTIRASYPTRPRLLVLRRARGVAQATRDRLSGRRIAIAAEVGAVALIAVVLYLVFRGGFPANDSWHSLIWGLELAHGQVPDYEVPIVPTPHPLLIFYTAVLSLLGVAANPALQLTGMVAFAVVALGLVKLGARLFAWPVGLLAAAILLTRAPFLNLGVRGNVDVMALAPIVWAVVLEIGRSRRGWPVLALLLVAGLIRPEAWLFSLAYWLWLLPTRRWGARVGLGALTATAPLLWALSDFLVTGDPLWSLHGTQDLAGMLERPTGLSVFPERTWRALGFLLTPPVVVLGGLGLLAGLLLRRKQSLVLAAIVAVAVGAFACLATFGLPLHARYLLPAGAVLTLFAAVVALGWVSRHARARARNVWRPIGIITLVVMAALLPSQLAAAAALRTDLVANQAVGSDLTALLDNDAIRRTLARCEPLVAPSNFRRPQIAYVTGRGEEAVRLAKRKGLPAQRGVYVRAKTRQELTRSGYPLALAPADFYSFRRDIGPRRAQAAPGYSTLASSRFWIASSRCGGRPSR